MLDGVYELNFKLVIRQVVCIFCIAYSGIAHSHDLIFTQAQLQQFIAIYAESNNLPPAFIKSTLEKAIYQPKTVSMQLNYMDVKSKVVHVPTPWRKFRQQFITQQKIQHGIKFMCDNLDALTQAQELYGVPPEIILGILGTETDFGFFTGHYRVIDTLTTLAFHSPRRVTFWQNELAKFLVMNYKYKINPKSFYGSIDGGFGLSQFMPSAYINFAITTQAGRVPNLLDRNDAIISIANYLHQHNWQSNQLFRIAVPINKSTCHKLNCNTLNTVHTLSSLQQLSEFGRHISKTVLTYHHNQKVAVITLDKHHPSNGFIVFPNFYSLYSYNHSFRYVMVVYELGHIITQHVNDCD